ncbi:histidine kinase [Ancylomarina sp. YFZ004]
MKLRNKSIVQVGIVIIVSFVIVAYLIGEKMSQTARNMSVDLAMSKAQNSFLIVKKELDESILRTRLLAESIEETIDMNTEGAAIMNKVFIAKLKLRNEINAVWYIPIDILMDLRKGYYYHENSSSSFQSGIDKKHLLMAGQLLDSKIETISAPYRGPNNRLISSILVPVIRNNNIIGVLGADLDLYRFQQHFYDNEALGRAYVSIISEQGYCISHPEQSHIGKSIDSLYDADADVIREVMSSGNKNHNEVHSNFLQVLVIRVYQPVKIGETDINWVITVSVPLFNVEEAVQEVRNSTALIGIVLAFLLMIFLYYSQHRWLSEFEGRQKAETKHRNILNKLSSIMESTDQIRIFSVDRKCRYTSFNSVYQKDASDNEGMEIEVGMSAINTYHHDFGDLMKKHFDRALRGEHFLTEYKRNNRHYQQVFNAIFDEEEKVIGFSSFRFDISETVELRKRAHQEEEEKVKAQLKNIKNQINPHFLFNSLNSLYALVETEPRLARKFILKLSKVYRYLLDRNNSSLVDLKQELDFMKHYIFLQKIRFGDNLSLEYDIPENYMTYKLPSVSLQSLVENAIKHNIVTTEKPLLISMRIENDRLLVENNYQLRSDFASYSGTGLKTLNALYSFLGDEKAEYGVEGEKFVVRLPLL